MKEILYKNMIATIVKSDDKKATIKAVFSTDTEDRHGESIKQKWFLKNFRLNPVILNSHNSWDATEVVGMASKIGMSKGNLAGEITFAVDENPKAKIIYELYKGGFLNAFSVGFTVKKFSEDYREILEAELLEISCVSIPANQEALQVAKSKGIDVEKLSPFYKFTDPKEDIEIEEDVDKDVEEAPENVEKPKKKPVKEVVEAPEDEEKEEGDEEEDNEKAKEDALEDIKEDEETAEVSEKDDEVDEVAVLGEDKKEDSKSLLSRAIKQIGEEAKAEKVVTLEKLKAEEVRVKRISIINKSIRNLLKIKKL